MYDSLFQMLYDSFTKYIHLEKDIDLIYRSYLYACEKHEPQFRKSGEPYINHPVAVALILSELKVGPNTLSAALLHDVVEDTDASLEDIKNLFGADIASMVDGVTKLSNLEFINKPSQADNHQKMLIAMAKDIRVILIKIADRLHNIKTLEWMRDDRQKAIARETLEIYAPIAHKLGLFIIKAELEDISLKYSEEEKYFEVSSLIQSKKHEREKNIENIIENIRKLFNNNNLYSYEIKGRIKNIFSIYKKMHINNRAFEDIYDLLAVRIIVDKLEECYQALGIIHANFTPLPRRFKDYIAVPKPNLYQSLHTTVLSADGTLFEVQIRTKKMDEVAEMGVAAHWAYKENKIYSKEKEQFEISQKLKWYSELLKMSEDVDDSAVDSHEFVESIKGDILGANVYVFTPKGEVIELPRGASPIDFAYRIHSDIGNKMVGATVNNKIVSIDYELKTGDIISIRTNKNSLGPSNAWLKIAKSSHAKHKIKAFINKRNYDALLAQGKELLEREINSEKVVFELNDEFVKKHFSKQSIKSVDELYVEISKGNISQRSVVAKLTNQEVNKDIYLKRQMEKASKNLRSNSDTGVIVEGLTSPLIRLANCCNPIPGDEIVGYVSKQGGLVVHSIKCPNNNSLDKARSIKVFWDNEVNRKFPALIKIVGRNSSNFLFNVVNTINASNFSVAEMNSQTNFALEIIVKVKIIIENLNQLEKLIVNLNKISDVYTVERDYR